MLSLNSSAMMDFVVDFNSSDFAVMRPGDVVVRRQADAKEALQLKFEGSTSQDHVSGTGGAIPLESGFGVEEEEEEVEEDSTFRRR